MNLKPVCTASSSLYKCLLFHSELMSECLADQWESGVFMWFNLDTRHGNGIVV